MGDLRARRAAERPTLLLAGRAVTRELHSLRRPASRATIVNRTRALPSSISSPLSSRTPRLPCFGTGTARPPRNTRVP